MLLHRLDISWAFMTFRGRSRTFHGRSWTFTNWCTVVLYGDAMGVHTIDMCIYGADCTMTCHEYFYGIVMNMPHGSAKGLTLL